MTNEQVIIATTKQGILDTPKYPSEKALKYINEVAKGLGIVDWLIKNRPEFYKAYE